MPPLRTLAAPMRVLLYAPVLYESGFKQRHVDGEALALHAHLRRARYDSTLLDAYYRAHHAPSLDDALAAHGPFDAVVVHLWTSDAYGPRLARVADELAAARARHQVPVLGFGPLATSAAAELAAHRAVDGTLGLAPGGGSISDPVLEALTRDVAEHLGGHTPLTGLTATEVPYQPDAVVSVSASRGCRSRCTFCAYNADLGGGWTPLPMNQVVADIAHLHELTGATRIAFADSDFGGTRAICHQRAVALRDALHRAGLAGRLRLSINVRSETLTADTISVLAEAGVDVMLIGVESFNPTTLHRLYGKRQDLDHLLAVVVAADRAGVTTVASYILWHPWQTLADLRRELEAIDTFGRHRIPQFLARSRLLVIPGTVAETQIRRAGLLEAGRFHRTFQFADPATADLYDQLSGWFTHQVEPALATLSEDRAGDLTTLAQMKIAEWQWLTQAVGPPVSESARALR